MKAFITGATGFIGGAVARAMKKTGHEVHVLVRQPMDADRLHLSGYKPVIGDMSQGGDWTERAASADIIIHAAQTRPGKRLSSRWLRQSRAERNSALQRLMDAARSGGNNRAFIYTSGVVAHGSHGAREVDEAVPFSSSAMGDFHREGENIVARAAASGLPALSLRPGFVYGAAGSFADFFLAEAKKGTYRYPGTGQNYLSLIHVDDLAHAYVRAAANPPVGEVVNVVDDQPLQMERFAQLLVGQFGGAKAVKVPSWLVALFAGRPLAEMLTGSYRVRNDKAKRLLQWQPGYARFADGIPKVASEFLMQRS